VKRGEDGAALALAIVLVLLAGLLAGAVAGLVATTSRFSSSMEADRQTSYAADGAADWAINQSAQTVQADSPTCVDSAPSLTVAPGLTSPVPPLTVKATKANSPRDGAILECSFVVSSASVTYVNADVEFFSSGTSPATAVKSWISRPLPGG
jgi:Tfp pilus assembly protein PilX